MAATGRDGSTDVAAVLRSLVSAPSEALALMRVAADAFLARNSLQRGRRLLGPGFGLLDAADYPSAPAPAGAPGMLSVTGGRIPLASEELLA